jgi:hypothetical protein
MFSKKYYYGILQFHDNFCLELEYPRSRNVGQNIEMSTDKTNKVLSKKNKKVATLLQMKKILRWNFSLICKTKPIKSGNFAIILSNWTQPIFNIDFVWFKIIGQSLLNKR